MLLSLPAELRSRIYDLALTQADYITVTPDLRQPRLLSVNRQIRKEARNIWYMSNTFDFRIYDCSDALLHKFCRHCYSIDVRPMVAFTVLELRAGPTSSSGVDICGTEK